MFLSALAPAAASLFAPAATRDAPKATNVVRGGAHLTGGRRRVRAASVALSRPESLGVGSTLTAMYATHSTMASLSGRHAASFAPRRVHRGAVKVAAAEGSDSDSSSNPKRPDPTFQGAPMSPGSGHGLSLIHI